MKKKAFALILALTMGVSLTACTENTGQSPGNSPASGSQTGEEAPEEITLFMGTAAISYPDGFDFADNFVMDALEEQANVKVTEVIVPPDSDMATKFNLMMSSGDICDVIHYQINAKDTYKLGKDGAFVELTDIIQNSEVFSKLYTPEMLAQMKADDGKIYSFRALLVDGDADTFAVRWDLLEGLGYAEMPDTLDGWLEAMRKLKEKYPDSLPYISRQNLHWAEFIFKTYGCSGNGADWQYYKGEIIPAFANPLYKEALGTYRQMIDEGLMDKEFPTTTTEDYQDKRLNRNVLINPQNIGGMVDWITRFPDNGIEGVMFIPGVYPEIDDERIDPTAVYGGPPTLNDHTISISSKSEHQDAALRFIEALFSEQNRMLSLWGREGVEYSIVDGEKVLDTEKSNETSWRTIFNFPFGYNTLEKLELSTKQFVAATDLSDEDKAEYETLFLENAKKAIDKRMSVPINPIGLIQLEDNNLSRKTDATNEALTIIMKTIAGEMSMEEFDQQAAAFIKKYQFITDDYNAKLPAVKETLGIE